jgi:hypothetical protein
MSASLTRALETNPEQVREIKPAAWLASRFITGSLKKLQSEPIEDNRIDFEDGYGNRPDDEEDGHAVAAADEVAKGMREGICSHRLSGSVSKRFRTSARFARFVPWTFS